MVNKRKNILLKTDIVAHILFVAVPVLFIYVLGFNTDFANGNERLGVILYTTIVYLIYMGFFVFFCGFTQKDILIQYLMRYFAVMYTGLFVLYTGVLATLIHGLCALLSMLFSIFVARKETNKKQKKFFVFLLIFYIVSGIISVFFLVFPVKYKPVTFFFSYNTFYSTTEGEENFLAEASMEITAAGTVGDSHPIPF